MIYSLSPPFQTMFTDYDILPNYDMAEVLAVEADLGGQHGPLLMFMSPWRRHVP